MKPLFALFLAVAAIEPVSAQLVYEGDSGFGKGKHIVFIANDHEYRSEQSCPALARILAKRFGFRCTVLFGVNDAGEIQSGGAGMPHLDSLKDADLLFFFARFMKLPDSQADMLVEYFERGGPVVGVRTSTHCFNGQKGKWGKLNYNYQGKDYLGGLGEQIFGITWHKSRGQSHYGSNHAMGSRITPVAESKDHPILAGVTQIHGFSGAYKSPPPADATPLLNVQVLNTFGPSDDINKEKPIVNAGWSRDSYIAPSGAKKSARVVYTSYGASEDLLSEDGRRFLVNACLWAGGWESAIKDDLNVEFVGDYRPTPYGNGSFFYEHVKPADLAGWETAIMPVDAKIGGIGDRKRASRASRALKNRPELRKKLAEMYPDLFGPNAKTDKK